MLVQCWMSADLDSNVDDDDDGGDVADDDVGGGGDGTYNNRHSYCYLYRLGV